MSPAYLKKTHTELLLSSGVSIISGTGLPKAKKKKHHCLYINSMSALKNGTYLAKNLALVVQSCRKRGAFKPCNHRDTRPKARCLGGWPCYCILGLAPSQWVESEQSPIHNLMRGFCSMQFQRRLPSPPV